MDLSTIIGCGLGIASLVVSYILYRKSLRTKEPRWSIQTTNLITNHQIQINKLAVLYDGQPIPNLSISKLAFWNNGRDTIHGQDITTAEPLKVVGLEHVKILDVELFKVLNPASLINISLTNEREALVTFDYLDYGDGVVFRILHTGTTLKDVQLSGKIKGATLTYQKFVRTAEFYEGEPGWRRLPPGWRRIFLMIINIPLALITFTGGVFITGYGVFPFFRLAYLIGGVFFVLIGGAWLWASLNLFRYTIPKAFQILDE